MKFSVFKAVRSIKRFRDAYQIRLLIAGQAVELIEVPEAKHYAEVYLPVYPYFPKACVLHKHLAAFQ